MNEVIKYVFMCYVTIYLVFLSMEIYGVICKKYKWYVARVDLLFVRSKYGCE